MQWTSILAIYALFWIMSAFILLPFGVRTHDELGIDKVPGQADSAPGNFRPGRLVIRATLIAMVLTTFYVLNYVYGWIGIEDLIYSPKARKVEPALIPQAFDRLGQRDVKLAHV